MTKVRSFICIELPEEVKKQIAEIQSLLVREPVAVSWTRPENVHLTLKFLGDVEHQRLPAVTDALIEVAARFNPFELVTGGAGVFPHERDPRVLWIGVANAAGCLVPLAEAVEEAMAAIGFARENRPFRAHLTVGRVRSSSGARELARKFISLTVSQKQFRVDRIMLMRSDLRPSGALYTPLRVLPLGSPPVGAQQE